jgi:transcription elongation factor GreA
MPERIFMTPTGYQKVLAELRNYREVLRPQNIVALEEARAHGDISENAEYDAAKDRQAHIEGHIQELEAKVGLAEVIDIAKMKPSETVIFGTTIELEDEDDGKAYTYRIVGMEEIDIKAGLISYSSPIGKALLGKKVGDEVRFDSPKGSRCLTILNVHYGDRAGR